MTGVLQWIADFLIKFNPISIINPWEQGLRVRFGKRTTRLGPGWHLRIPIIDEVTSANTRLTWAAFPSQSLNTKDNKSITIAGLVGYRIVDLLECMMTIQQPEYSVPAFVQAVVSTYITETDYLNINKVEIEQQALEELKEFAKGIVIDAVTVTDLVCARPIRLIQEDWRPETQPAYYN